MAPRTYTSPLRQAEAGRTRAAIVDAASRLFSRDGYPATTMNQIANEAGVSVQSVRLAGSKAALLIAAFERTFAGDEGQHSLAERPAIMEIMGRADTADALAGWLDYVADANERTAGLSRAMLVAAETDPLAAAAVTDLDERRRADIGRAIAWLADRGIPVGDDPAVSADELSHLVGPESYAFFVDRSGWPVERYRAWMEAAVRSLLARWRGGAPGFS